MTAGAVLRVTGRVCVWLGIALLAFAGGATGYGCFEQRVQSARFAREVIAARSTGVTIAELHEGDVVGRLEIPAVSISVVVLQGVEAGTLLIGAGHLPGTPLPGEDGNVAIAAHRDTFFRRLEGIRPGDRIEVATVSRTCEYIVTSIEIVDPGDTRVIESRDRPELTLITCYPFHFVGAAPRRFIVHAQPVD